MNLSRLTVCSLVPCLGAALVACSSADPYGAPLAGSGFAKPGQTLGGAAPGTPGGCVQSAPTPTNPATLPACCATGQTGRARCVQRENVPASVAGQLDACSGGLCVPEPHVRDPNFVPKKCKSLNGGEGACTSVCVPAVAEVSSILPQDVCEADEKCAPCTDPRTGQPSGACNIAPSPVCAPGSVATAPPGSPATGAPATCPHVGPPVLDPNTLPLCGTAGGAHCLGKELVPAALQSQLAACPTGLCVPDDFIRTGGNFIPATCRSIAGVEGRCLHGDLPQVAVQKASLPTSTCLPYERCAPCFDPVTGQATGACQQSCDPGPREPAQVFRGCCPMGNQYYGRCIPSALIPPNQDKDYLDDEACGEGSGVFCVPAEMVPTTFVPTKCQGSGLFGSYGGVCLSNCLDFGIEALALSRGTCDSIHTCVPCIDPLSGGPSGAPGCQ